MRKKKNQGSAVIEFTLLMPIVLGCIYFYIMLFLFFIQSGKVMDQLADCIYQPERENVKTQEIVPDGVNLRKEGTAREAWVDWQEGLFHLHLTMRKDENDPVKCIRRWQFVTDLF